MIDARPMRLDDLIARSMTAPPAIVGGDEVSLSVARDLGRRGVPVLAMSPDGAHAAFRSRYCAAGSCADPRLDEEKLIADLEAVAALLPRRAVLFPCDDDYCVAVSRHKARLQESFIVPVLAWEGMQTLADKERSSTSARAGRRRGADHRLHPRPRRPGRGRRGSALPGHLKTGRSQGALPHGRVQGRAGRGRHRARARLRALCRLRLLPAAGDHPRRLTARSSSRAPTTTPSSRCLALFTGRKLRQHPRGFGVSRLCESGWSEEIAELTLRILAEVGYQGVSDVEFKRDPRDGRFKFMEINARQGYWIALARAAGVNLSYIAYRDAIGQPCPQCRQRDGVRWSDSCTTVPTACGSCAAASSACVTGSSRCSACGPMPTCRCTIRDPGSTRWRARRGGTWRTGSRVPARTGRRIGRGPPTVERAAIGPMGEIAIGAIGVRLADFGD